MDGDIILEQSCEYQKTTWAWPMCRLGLGFFARYFDVFWESAWNRHGISALSRSLITTCVLSRKTQASSCGSSWLGYPPTLTVRSEEPPKFEFPLADDNLRKIQTLLLIPRLHMVPL